MALEMDPKQAKMLVIGAAVAGAVVFWMYWRGPTVEAQAAQRDSIATLQATVESATQVLKEGTREQIQARIEDYGAVLDLMRRLVPTESEVTTLVDDISLRAARRGVVVAEVAPLAKEPGPPYDVQRYRFRVIGHYDQIGELLSDIASLSQIMVPVKLSLTRVDAAVGRQFADTSGALLQATFELRTFVKQPEVGETGGAP
jgi:Tfp pilus assembly protein PilO